MPAQILIKNAAAIVTCDTHDTIFRDFDLLINGPEIKEIGPKLTAGKAEVIDATGCFVYPGLIITYRIAEVMSIADRVAVLRDGENVASLDIQETGSSHLSELMIGRRLETPARPATASGPSSETPVRLSAKGISLHGETKKILDNIFLDIRRGEILGLAGVDGNGQKELAEVLAGIRKSDDGQIVFEGRITGVLKNDGKVELSQIGLKMAGMTGAAA